MVNDQTTPEKRYKGLHLVNAAVGTLIIFFYSNSFSLLSKYAQEIIEENGQPLPWLSDMTMILFKPLMSGYFWKIAIYLVFCSFLGGTYVFIKSSKIRQVIQFGVLIIQVFLILVFSYAAYDIVYLAFEK